MEKIQKLWSNIDNSPRKKSIILILNNYPMTIGEISDLTKIKHSNVSNAIYDLLKYEIVYCVNEEDKKRSGKKYFLTEIGKEILKEIKRIEKIRKSLKKSKK